MWLSLISVAFISLFVAVASFTLPQRLRGAREYASVSGGSSGGNLKPLPRWSVRDGAPSRGQRVLLYGEDEAKHIEAFSAEPAKAKPKEELPQEEILASPIFALESVRMGKGDEKVTRKALAIDMPRVIPPGTVGNNRDWLLWCHCRDDEIDGDVVKFNSGRICFATSRNGLTNWKFDEDSPIMGPNKENGDWFYFDAEHIGLGDVIQPGDRAQNKFNTMGGVFLMYIFGGRNEIEEIGDEEGKKMEVKGSKLEIGVAVSQDGAHWSRVEGPSPYGGIVDYGKEGEFDHAYVGWPSVIEIGNDYRMFYHTYDRKDGMYKIGLAMATDGLMTWKKKGMVFAGSTSGDFDRRGATRRHVVNLLDGSYKMWYEGISETGEHSIGVATSQDGFKWTANTEPVFTANKDDSTAWDSGGVGSPHVVWIPQRKVWRMYYSGTSSTSGGHHDDTGELGELFATNIGVAESLDEDGEEWRRL